MRYAARSFLVLVIILAGAPRLVAQTQQGSPIDDYMTRSRNALNDLRYSEADSLARFILAFGNLLTPQQRIDALHLRAAAAYPDDAGMQSTDTAIAVIRELVQLGAAGLPPREISWSGLDSLFTFVARAVRPAVVRLGSRTPGAVLYVDGQPLGVIQRLRFIELPTGKPVQLSLRAEGCVSWDSTIVTQAADSMTIGWRNPRCSK